MRHGRKSKSKRFNGYKQHIGTHLDAQLVLARTVTPANRPEEEATPELKGPVVQFEPEVCGACALRAQCTHAASGRGRSVRLDEDEGLQKRLRRLQATRSGRAKLRERVPVEHHLAHLGQRQGSRARYRGTRKNTCAGFARSRAWRASTAASTSIGVLRLEVPPTCSAL